MEYVVYTYYANDGSIRKLKYFDSWVSAKKFCERLEEEVSFPIFIRERESYDHDSDLRPYKFRRISND